MTRRENRGKRGTPVSQPGAITHAPEGMVDREMHNATAGKVGMWIYLVTDANPGAILRIEPQ